jgi:hypothetical protein
MVPRRPQSRGHIMHFIKKALKYQIVAWPLLLFDAYVIYPLFGAHAAQIGAISAAIIYVFFVWAGSSSWREFW